MGRLMLGLVFSRRSMTTHPASVTDLAMASRKRPARPRTSWDRAVGHMAAIGIVKSASSLRVRLAQFDRIQAEGFAVAGGQFERQHSLSGFGNSHSFKNSVRVRFSSWRM